MQIPVANPLAGYPQPYATWAMLRDAAGAHGGAGAVNDTAGSSADATAPPAYTVDVAA